MISALLYSIGMTLFFICLGWPYSHLMNQVNLEEDLGGIFRVCLACALGVSIPLVTCTAIISMGGWWPICIAVNSVVWFTALIQVLRKYWVVNLLQLLKSRLQDDFRATIFFFGLVALSAGLLYFSKPPDAILGIRIGVDSALYIDGAQTLIENDGIRGLNNIAESAITQFGPAAFLDHMRWGVPILLTIVTNVFNFEHSIQTALPLLAFFIGLVSFVTIDLVKRLSVPQNIAVFGGLAVAANYVVINLALEGQWAQLFSIPLFSIFVWLITVDREISFVHQLSLAFVLGAAVLMYGEIAPIFVFIALVAICLGGGRRTTRRQFARNSTNLIFCLFFAAMLIFPYFSKYVVHMRGLSTTVGYPTPHKANGSEILGVGSIWTKWKDWLDVENAPIMIGRTVKFWDTIRSVAGYGILLFGLSMLISDQRQKRFWIALFIAVVAVWLQFNIKDESGYLWMKATSSLFIFFIASVIYGIYRMGTFTNKVFTQKLLAVFCLSVFATTFQQLESFRSVSRPISKDILDVRNFLSTTAPCVLTVALSNSDQEFVYARDRVFLIVLSSIFRDNPLVLGSNSINFAGELDQAPKRLCILTLKSDQNETVLGLGERVLYENDNWAVLLSAEKFSI